MDNPQEGTFLSARHSDVPVDVRSVTAGPGHGNCRDVTPVLNRVGDKWSMLIIMILADGSLRFNELKRAIDGISQRMLTLSLRSLERDGLVSRTVTNAVPVRVDYALTELGMSLREPVKGLGEWAMAHIGCIRSAQIAFDKAHDPA